MNQRWKDQRDSYRPGGETIDPRRFEVAELHDDNRAKRFVEEHHYSGSYPAARYRFGLYHGPSCVGVAVFSVPMSNAVITNVFPIPPSDGVELGRFVLLDEVPGNGETWFLRQCFSRLARHGLAGVVSFSDPAQRTNRRGEIVFGGHVGTIYQAFNACYLGRGTARTHQLLPDGSILSPRAKQKLLNRERGWQYVVELLERHGAERPGSDLRAWGNHWIARLTRPLRHQGNHKYAWPLRCSLRKHLTYGKHAYPKQLDVSDRRVA